MAEAFAIPGPLFLGGVQPLPEQVEYLRPFPLVGYFNQNMNPGEAGSTRAARSGTFLPLAPKIRPSAMCQKVAGVIQDAGRLNGEPLLVKLIHAVEDRRPVLRIVIPDQDGNLDLGQIADSFAVQYDKRGPIAILWA